MNNCIVHESPGDVQPMPGIVVQTANGRVLLSRAKFREIETGVVERAVLDSKTFTILGEQGFDAMHVLGLWAVREQVMADASIDLSVLDSAQTHSLFWSYVVAFATQQKESVQ